MTDSSGTKRRIFKYIGIGFGSLVVLVLLLLVLAVLPPGEAVIRDIAEDQLSSALGQPVSIGEFRTNLFSRVTLSDIRLQPADSAGLTPARISRVYVEYGIGSLLADPPTVERVQIDTVTISAVRDSVGGFNMALIERLMAPSDEPDAATMDTSGGDELPVRIIDFNLVDLTVTYDDNVLPMRARVNSLSLASRYLDETGYEFELRSDTGEVSYADYPPGVMALHARGAFRMDRLAIDTVQVQIEQLRLTAKGTLSDETASPLNFTADLTGDPTTWLRLMHQEFEMPEIVADGPLAISADLTGSMSEPDGTITADFPTVTVSGYRVEEPYVGLEKSGDSLRIDSLLVRGFGGRVNGSGYVILDTTLNADVTLQLASVDLDDLWQSIYDEKSPYGGAFDGEVALQANGTDWLSWRVEADVRAGDASYQERPMQNLRLQVTLDQGALSASVREKRFMITTDVTLTDSTVEGTIAAEIERLAPLAGWANLSGVDGSLRADGSIAGRYENPHIEASVSGSDITYENFPVDSLSAKIRLIDSMLYIDTLIAGASMDTIPLDRPLFGIDSLRAGFAYQANVVGTLDSLRGVLDLRLQEVKYGQITVDSGTVSVGLNGKRVSLESLAIYRDSLELQTRGDFDMTGSAGSVIANTYNLAGKPSDTTADSTVQALDFDDRPPAERLVSSLESSFKLPDTGALAIEATGRAFDLSVLNTFLSDSIRVGGMMNFDLRLSGSLDEPDVTLAAEIDKPQYNEFALDSVLIRGSFADGRANLDTLRLFKADQHIVAGGSLAIQKDTSGSWIVNDQSRTSGSIDISEFDLGRLSPLFEEGMRLQGLAKVDMRWDGTFNDPNVNGTLEVDSGLFVFSEEREPVEKIFVTATIRDTTLTLTDTRAVVQGTNISAGGTVTLLDWSELRADIQIRVDTINSVTGQGVISQDRLDFTARIDELDLALLRPFVPGVTDLDGRVSAQIALTGSGEDPRIDGRIDADSLIVGHEALDQPLTSGRLLVSFTKNDVGIDTLSGKLGKGTFMVSGTLQHSDGKIVDVDMGVRADSISFTVLDEFSVVVRSADIDYVRDGDIFKLEGTLVMGETRYQRDLNPTEFLSFSDEVERVETPLPEFLQNTRLSIRLKDSDRLWIDNNVSHVRAHAELEFSGTVREPRISGRLSVVEGYVMYLDRKFDVVEGVAYFTDPNQINPEINIRAEATVKTYEATAATQYTIILGITGRLDEFQFELRSEPPLERADIISLLTLGATRAQLSGEGDATTGDILQERGEVLVSRQISSYVGGKAANLFGLDQVSVRGNIFNMSDTTGPEIVAAKQISDRVRLTYRTRVGQLNEQAIAVDYELTKHWLLEGETNRRGESALSLKYALRFR